MINAAGQILFTIILDSVPILLAALGGALTQKADILNIGLEGMMLAGAFASIAVGALTQSAALAVLAAVVSGLLVALLFAWVSLVLRANFIVVGIGISLLADGITVFLLERLYNNEGSFSPHHFPSLWQLNLGPLARIPLLGPALNGQSAIAIFALALVPLTGWFLYRTTIGLRIRAVGENEEAAAAAGIKPVRVKFLTVLLSGVLSGLGGAQLAMGTLDMFTRGMTNGRGYIALAALTFGNAEPGGTFLASVIFGAANAASDRLQFLQIPSQLVLMIPYLVTILALLFVRLRQRARRIALRSEIELPAGGLEGDK